jgi:heme exporter protein A
MLAGLTTPAHGHVLWKGRSIQEQRSDYHAELLFLGHLAAVSEMMSVRENLEAWVQLDSGSEPGPELDAALERVGLKSRRNLQARMLSQGQRRRIGLARLLLSGRSIWLLDEPTTALDVAGIEMLGGALDRHLRRGGNAVIATHQAVPIENSLATEIALG